MVAGLVWPVDIAIWSILTSVNSKLEMCSGAPVRGINIVIIASMTSTITLNHKLLALKLRIEYYRRLSRGKGGGGGG